MFLKVALYWAYALRGRGKGLWAPPLNPPMFTKIHAFLIKYKDALGRLLHSTAMATMRTDDRGSTGGGMLAQEEVWGEAVAGDGETVRSFLATMLSSSIRYILFRLSFCGAFLGSTIGFQPLMFGSAALKANKSVWVNELRRLSDLSRWYRYFCKVKKSRNINRR